MANEIPELINEVHRKIGRNLLRFQYIELFLKQILPYTSSGNKPQPYIYPDGIDPEGFRKYQETVQSKTFGSLIGEFNKFNEIPDGFFDQALQKVLDARNQLVHHFLEIPGVECLSTVIGINYALCYLDAQFKEAEEFFEFTKHQSLALLLSVLDTASKNNPNNPKYEGLIEQLIEILPPTFEYIDEGDPSKTVWRNTRIVQLSGFLAGLRPRPLGRKERPQQAKQCCFHRRGLGRGAYPFPIIGFIPKGCFLIV